MSRIAVLFCILLLAVSATGQVQSFGETSFAVPSGWEYGTEPSADHATLSMSQGGQVVAMAVFRSLRGHGKSRQINYTPQGPHPCHKHKSYSFACSDDWPKVFATSDR